MSDANVDLDDIGRVIEARVLDELGATRSPQFVELEQLQNLAGDNTGYVRVYHAGKLVKASFLSIDVGPGRYFNIHLIPEPCFDVPRFVYEGMLIPGSSQVSLDLFPDMDKEERVLDLLELYADAVRVYDEARQNPDLQLQPSRFLHMRAFSSPVFMLVQRVPDAILPGFESYAEAYLDAWLKLLGDATEVLPEASARRQARRAHMARMLIRLDPDRDMVVQVYGEEMTQAIEAASML